MIGYKQVEWKDMSVGDEVYILGRKEGTPHMYGPYTVKDQARRLLVNNVGAGFMNYPEELWMKQTEREKHPELNWKEADEASDEELESAAEFYDRLRKQRKEGN